MIITGGRCSITGWGADSVPRNGYFDENVLRRLVLPIVDYTLCQQSYNNIPDPGWNSYVRLENQCAGYYDKAGKGGRFQFIEFHFLHSTHSTIPMPTE